MKLANKLDVLSTGIPNISVFRWAPAPSDRHCAPTVRMCAQPVQLYTQSVAVDLTGRERWQ